MGLRGSLPLHDVEYDILGELVEARAVFLELLYLCLEIGGLGIVADDLDDRPPGCG